MDKDKIFYSIPQIEGETLENYIARLDRMQDKLDLALAVAEDESDEEENETPLGTAIN